MFIHHNLKILNSEAYNEETCLEMWYSTTNKAQILQNKSLILAFFCTRFYRKVFVCLYLQTILPWSEVLHWCNALYDWILLYTSIIYTIKSTVKSTLKIARASHYLQPTDSKMWNFCNYFQFVKDLVLKWRTNGGIITNLFFFLNDKQTCLLSLSNM